MSWSPPASGIPATARYHRQAIEEIITAVQEGVYCALLGPRLCGKTVLLQYVEGILERMLDVPCIYLDMRAMRSTTLRGFFAELIRFSARHFNDLAGQQLFVPAQDASSSAALRGFLVDSVAQTQRDVVLIIEHLEAVPVDLVQALLTCLRAAYMDQQTLNNRLIVIVSGALSLASLTVGESSPFRGIARRIFIGDLTAEASQMLIEEYLAAGDIDYTPFAGQRLLQATRGDQFLIRKICQRCVDLVRSTSMQRLGAPGVNRITSRFLNRDVIQYAPLLEAVRLIEDDPDLLQCILMLLENERVPVARLPLPLSPDLDPLYLTGVVERVGDDYRLQNLIYRQFLTDHFAPGRVGHMLAMAGCWDAAIDYLETGIHGGDEILRGDLLPATIHSMYAAEDLGQAAHFLNRGLSAVFGVREAQVWFADRQAGNLNLIGRLISEDNGSARPDPRISLRADCLEARAFRQGVSLRGPEQANCVWRVIPLVIPGSEPLGVVAVWDALLLEHFGEQRERDMQMVGYLHQAARALQAVSIRRQELTLAGRMQASLLPAATPQSHGWDFAATWRPARETSGDFYDFITLPGARIGLLIADVVDKGMGAALYMALSRTLIRTFALEFPPQPDQVLRAVNNRLLSDAAAEHFVTTFYAVLNPATGEMTYCNAGHHPPYLFDPFLPGQVRDLPRTGMALGVTARTAWQPETIHLRPGAVLVLYTDGVVDAIDPDEDMFGAERLLEIVQTNTNQSAEHIQQAILDALSAFRGEAPQFDDISLVIVKREASAE